MKDLREIYQALIDGKTLINKQVGGKVTIETSCFSNFSYPDAWEIYETQTWDEKETPFFIENDGTIYLSEPSKNKNRQKFGMAYCNKDQATKAKNQMKQANLLRFWVSTIQDLDKGTTYIYSTGLNRYSYYTEKERDSLAEIYMTEKTAEIICDALNNKKLILN
jgi:hypothetical protein